MKKAMKIVLLLCFIFPRFVLLSDLVTAQSNDRAKINVNVGVVVDYDSHIGRMGRRCIELAFHEFYESHPEFNTRIKIRANDSDSNVSGAASAAQNLIQNEQVNAILGPTTSKQAIVVVELGEKARVPIISFSPTSSIFTHRSLYFFVATQSESSQAKAIAAIVQSFRWKRVVPIYSADPFSEGLIPFLADALIEANDAHMPYQYAVDRSVSMDGLRAELRGLMMKEVRVFLLHTDDLSLAKRIFAAAKEIEMMREGFVWIVTNVLTDMLSASMESHEDLNGVLGIRTFVPETEELEGFRGRYRKGQFRDKEVDVFGLRAYDAATALSIAVEEIWNSGDGVKFGFTKGRESESLMVSQSGPKLQRALSNVSFKGLAGNFSFVNGELQVSSYEIINFVNGDVNNVVGFWTPKLGLVRDLNNSEFREEHYNTSKDNLGRITWPGQPDYIPKGWENNPILGEKLKVGVPMIGGFKEFVRVIIHPNGTKTFEGYCVDIFEAVVDAMPYHVGYEFIEFDNTVGGNDYDTLVRQVFEEKFDVVVGDLTIRLNRSQYVDFTLPYLESGVSMVVPRVNKRINKSFYFLEPLTWDLWMTSAIFFIFIGFVVWVLEHRINEEFRGPPSHQIGTSAWFAFSTIVFAHRERVISNLSRFVIIIWMFVVVILTQSYTASLASRLTAEQLRPAFTNFTELREKNHSVGCLKDSFVREILKHEGFSDSQIKYYDSVENLNSAFSKASKGEGFAAAFDESPYLNLFLRKHCHKYTMVEPKLKTDGFGFAFRIGSPLIRDVSRAILNVTENSDLIRGIEQKWFGDVKDCPEPNLEVSETKLGLESFRGLFLIAGVSAILALAIHAAIFFHAHWDTITTSSPPNASIWDKIRIVFRLFDQIDSSSHAFRNNIQMAEARTSSSSRHGVGRFQESQSNRGQRNLHIVGDSPERESSRN